MYGYEYLIEFFKEEGFRYEDKGSFLSFKIQGNRYVASTTKSEFLQIIMFCNVEGVDRIEILEACNAINNDKYVAKFTVNDDSDRVWASYEFRPNKDTTSDDFMEIFQYLDNVTDAFFLEHLNK